MTREQKIKRLIDNDFNDIRQELLEFDGCSFLYDIISGGWKGYDQMTNDEINYEYESREFPE